MPVLTGIDRFATILRNAFRNRGPFTLQLGDSAQPTYDLGAEHPEFDDAIVYWYLPAGSAAALAGNFSTIWLNCSAGRAIVDGISVLGQAAAQTYKASLVAQLGSNNTQQAMQANAYVSRAGVTFPLVLPVIATNWDQTAGGHIGATNGYSWTAPIGGEQLSWKVGTFPAFLLSPSVSLALEPNNVNLNNQIAAWGRWWPEVDPA